MSLIRNAALRPRTRLMLVGALAATMSLAISYPAMGSGAKLSLHVSTKHPSPGQTLKLKIKGKAVGTAVDIDIYEQSAGKCAASNIAEKTQSGTTSIISTGVSGHLKTTESVTAVSTPNAKELFCGYLTKIGKTKPEAKAKASYTTT